MDEIVKQITPGNWSERYFHYEARGHCAFQTDPFGNIQEQYDFDAFGWPYFYDASGNDLGYSPFVTASSLEAAIIGNFPPGRYTAILRGNNGSSGIGLVESYTLN